MNLLLDTHAVLWWREGNRKLGTRARKAIESQAATVRVSAVTAWELAIKVGLGRLTLPQPLDRWLPAVIESGGFLPLPVLIEHALTVAGLPDHHADPFDRLLIAQARAEDLTILTADAAFEAYDVAVLDARA